MCGIAGIVGVGLQAEDLRDLEAMGERLAHRGPDGRGFGLIGDGRVRLSREAAADGMAMVECAFAHRRLSILDLSESGRQPMATADGSVVMVFNGEIYNYLELRGRLEAKGYRFVGTSDSEVLLNLYHDSGLEAFEEIEGMYAAAFYHVRDGRLVMVRDPFGIKPLYYLQQDGRFFFASEIKALAHLPRYRPRADEEVVWAHLVTGRRTHGEATFFAGVRSVLPGQVLVVSRDGALARQSHFSVDSNDEVRNPTAAEEEEVTELIRDRFVESIRLHLRSDVPVGAYLSGGIDSGGIVGVIRKERLDAASGVTAYTACYENSPFDERQWVDEFRVRYPGDYRYVFPPVEDMASSIDEFVYSLDEPVVSGSYFINYSMMRRIAADGLKVMLTGEGGDELFAGYGDGHVDTFFWEMLRHGRWTDARAGLRLFRQLSNRGVSLLIKAQGERLLGRHVLPMRRKLVSHGPFVRPEFWTRHAGSWEGQWFAGLNRRLAYDSLVGNLPDLNNRADRMSMAHSIESRVPFCNKALFRAAMKVPSVYKVRHGYLKYVLRRALKDYLPQSYLERKVKQGFGGPEALSFVGPLRAMLADSGNGFATGRFVDFAKIGQVYGDAFKVAHTLNRTEKLYWDIARLWRLFNLEKWARIYNVEC